MVPIPSSTEMKYLGERVMAGGVQRATGVAMVVARNDSIRGTPLEPWRGLSRSDAEASEIGHANGLFRLRCVASVSAFEAVVAPDFAGVAGRAVSVVLDMAVNVFAISFMPLACLSP